MYDTMITTTAQQAHALHTDREHGHRAVMALWGQRNSSTLRADLSVLWAVTAADLLADKGQVLVRSAEPPERNPSWAGSMSTIDRTDYHPEPGAPLRLRLEFDAAYTPHVPVSRDIERDLKQGADGTARPPGHGLAFRAQRTAVSREGLPAWSARKLVRHGIAVENVEVVRMATIYLPQHREKHRPIAMITVSGTVSDTEAYRHALSGGVGKGKAFGLGCIRESSTDTIC